MELVSFVISSQTQGSNIEELVVKRQLLRFQSPTTGLFPVLSSDRVIGSVRDSIYCAAAIWSLYQAYR